MSLDPVDGLRADHPQPLHPARPLPAAEPARRADIDAAWHGPRPLVFTNGVFDVLHAGHVECLEQARRLGRALVVGVNSDASARRLGKGPGRPLNGQAERARVVGALAAVSAVFVFDEDAPLTLIRRLRPEIYVKGGDYTGLVLPEQAVLAAWDGRTVIVPRVPELSTSGLIERIARLPAVGEGP